MVGTLFLMIKFIFKQIETVHVSNRATCIRPPPTYAWGSDKLKIETVHGIATEQHVLDLTLPTHPYRPYMGLPHMGGWGSCKVDGQIEIVHICNRAICIRPPPTQLKNYKVFKSQITKPQITSQWAIRMQETWYILRAWIKLSLPKKNLTAQHHRRKFGVGVCHINTQHRATKLTPIIHYRKTINIDDYCVLTYWDLGSTRNGADSAYGS